MYARIVRFTGVDQETIDRIRSGIESDDGPPGGTDIKSMKLFHDSDQDTSVFVAFFDTAEAMTEADAVFEAMDRSDTPGTRASVDRCEVVIERDIA